MKDKIKLTQYDIEMKLFEEEVKGRFGIIHMVLGFILILISVDIGVVVPHVYMSEVMSKAATTGETVRYLNPALFVMLGTIGFLSGGALIIDGVMLWIEASRNRMILIKNEQGFGKERERRIPDQYYENYPYLDENYPPSRENYFSYEKSLNTYNMQNRQHIKKKKVKTTPDGRPIYRKRKIE